MIVQGGIYDVIRDPATLLELCGAEIIHENGKNKVKLDLWDEHDPPRGMIKYDELISSGILDGANMELSANVAAIVAPPDDPYDGSFAAEKIRGEMTR